jgi:tol-pal system protein YbgF
MMPLKRNLLYSLILSLFFALPLQAGDNSEALLELFQRIDRLAQEIRTLRGENERLQHTLGNLKKAQKEGFLGIDERIDSLSKRVKLATKAQTPNTITKPATPTASSQKEKPKKADPKTTTTKTNTEKKPAILSQKTEAKKTQTETNIKKPLNQQKTAEKPNSQPAKKAEVAKPPTSKLQTATIEEKTAYNQAYKKINDKPLIAIQAFRNYIKKHPKSPLAANAQYWIGEVMYSERNYSNAVDEFVKVLQNYRKSDKAPDAAIKLGFSFYELKNWVYARRALEDVKRYFPRTKAAALATQRIAKMKADGQY